MITARPFENPLFHLDAYGLQNPVVQWCIERGVYDGVCPKCAGKGQVFSRPCVCAEPGQTEYVPGVPIERVPGGCRYCRSLCRACRGSGLTKDFEVLESDFGDAESMAFALRHMTVCPKEPPGQGYERGTRRLR